MSDEEQKLIVRLASSLKNKENNLSKNVYCEKWKEVPKNLKKQLNAKIKLNSQTFRWKSLSFSFDVSHRRYQSRTY